MNASAKFESLSLRHYSELFPPLIRGLRVDVPGDSNPRTWTIGFDEPPRSGGEGRRRALAPDANGEHSSVDQHEDQACTEAHSSANTEAKRMFAIASNVIGKCCS